MIHLIDNRLTALAHVLRLGSFEAAADALAVTPSAISQRIKGLEDQMGTVLVLRGQPCTGTEAGRALAAHYDRVARLEGELAQDLGMEAPEGQRPEVRIAVNADSLETWFVSALTQVRHLSFQIFVDDQDHSADMLRKGEVAAAVSAHPGPVQGCDTHALGALRYLATASPDFIAKWFPDGVTADALEHAPSLIFGEKDTLQNIWAERIAGKRVTLPVQRLPSTRMFVIATAEGLGWGLNPEPLIRRQIKRNRLVALTGTPEHDTPLYWQVSRIGRSVLGPLTDAVLKTARDHLIQND